MTDSDLERIYTTLCQNITAEGEAQAPLYLARLALLCITELGDMQRAMSLIEAARLPSGAVTAAT
ncbi:hypothetical protein [Paraburkholderia caledonica]|jgi:hypothetical protein|uniref:hypothetical protein n=1 Tax=Paraburkholderia caledonica TaxID=134536 RepID=UPI0004880739|nr:hypothetical protein [Paraburkholderia caledonica]